MMPRLILAILLLLPLSASAQPVSGTSPGAASATAPGVSAYGTTAGTAAQGNDSRITGALQTGPLWSLNLATSAQSFSATTFTTQQFNTKRYDTATICNVTTTYVCTPNVAGYYQVTCSAYVTATTGPAVNSTLAISAIVVNSTAIYVGRNLAEVISLVNPVAYANVTGVVSLNGSSDTVSCQVYSDSTSPVLGAITTSTFMTGSFVHP